MAGIPNIDPYPLPGAGELPHNQASWTVDPARAVLLIHDMQRYFVAPVPDPEPRATLIRHLVALREWADEHGVPVAYTTQPGGMTVPERGLLADFWGAGMQVTPDDRDVVPQLRPQGGDWVMTKWRYSAFHRSDLLTKMRLAGRDQLVLTGIYAHIGVLATAVDAFTHDIQPFLVADGVADFSATYHRMALCYAAERCGVVLPTKEIVK